MPYAIEALWNVDSTLLYGRIFLEAYRAYPDMLYDGWEGKTTADLPRDGAI